MKTERQIQDKIIKKLKSEGFFVTKLISTSTNGIADILAIKNGIAKFVEVKRKDGKLSEIQKYRIEELKKYIVKGKTYCFLGSSGVGKSTLIKILSGAVAKEKGEIYLNGELVSPELSPKERLDKGEGMPQYMKDHPIYYAGPAKRPAGMPSGSFGPT